jgi:hypothetical protein
VTRSISSNPQCDANDKSGGPRFAAFDSAVAHSDGEGSLTFNPSQG